MKEPVLEGAKSAAKDTKGIKSISQRDLGNISNEEEKQVEAHKADSNQAMKLSQCDSNNIMSKVRQSFVKAKKVIIGRSSCSKTLTLPVEVDEIPVK